MENYQHRIDIQFHQGGGAPPAATAICDCGWIGQKFYGPDTEKTDAENDGNDHIVAMNGAKGPNH